MQYALVALPAFVLSALAVPTPVIDNLDLSIVDNVVSGVESSLPVKRQTLGSLKGVNVNNVDLQKLSLEDLSVADLKKLNAEGLDLQKLNLDNLDLSNIDLNNLDLNNGDVSTLPVKRQSLDSTLENVDLQHVDLSSLDLENIDLSDVDLSSVLSDVDLSTLLTKRQTLDDLELNAVKDLVKDIDLDSVRDTAGLSDSSDVVSLPTDSILNGKRQSAVEGEPVVDLLDGLLASISPIAGEIIDLVGGLASSAPVTESTNTVVDIEGLITLLIIEVEGVLGNVTKDVADGDDLSAVLTNILALVERVENQVTKTIKIDEVDALIQTLNTDIDGLVSVLGGVDNGLLKELNKSLGGEGLKELGLNGLDLKKGGLLG